MIIMNVHEKLPADSKRTCNLGISRGAINNKHRFQLQLQLQLDLQLQHSWPEQRVPCTSCIEWPHNERLLKGSQENEREDVPLG